ncbi:hypothetical protein [Actinomyces naeslundii]|uniref:Leucine rich repeat variant domain-containing protein n=1 Tax=Actinomyces naeslundii TaxID=1655 RepID=A0AA47FK96_ACTNA|nr:hypothetical protein [Actinomyces naeslundii]OMG15706.1 hypothetical protein BKH04_10850 [Actinomyces naeslundii]PKY96337.1 hypothetical protein CYJ18_03585 [Actinomyces naeslundii]WAL43816.1 hypothetical protein OFA60_04510 [Actinomyces naeslundii]
MDPVQLMMAAHQADAAVAAQTPDQALQAAIAQSRPDLWAPLSTNPAAYPDLLGWLASTGNVEVLANLRARGFLTDDAEGAAAGTAGGEPVAEPAAAQEAPAEAEPAEEKQTDAEQSQEQTEVPQASEETEPAEDDPTPVDEDEAEAAENGETATETEEDADVTEAVTSDATDEAVSTADDDPGEADDEQGTGEVEEIEEGAEAAEGPSSDEPDDEGSDEQATDLTAEPTEGDEAADGVEDVADEAADSDDDGAGTADEEAEADESFEDESGPGDQAVEAVEDPAAGEPADDSEDESVAADEGRTEDIPEVEDSQTEPIPAADEGQTEDIPEAEAPAVFASASQWPEVGSAEAMTSAQSAAPAAGSVASAAGSADSVALPVAPPPSAEDIAAWAETPSGAPSGFSAAQPAVEQDMFGVQMAAQIPPQQQKQSSRSGTGRLVAIIVVLLLIIAGGGGVWAGNYFSSKDKDDDSTSQDKAGEGGNQNNGQADAAATSTATALPSGAVKACSSMPTFTITSVEDGQGELNVQGNVTTSCAEGDFLGGSSTQVLIYSSASPTGGADVDHLVASGTFDLSGDPLIIPNGGRAVTLRFGEQHYFRTAKDLDLKTLTVKPSFDRGSQSSVTSKSSTNSPMTMASSTNSNANQQEQDEQAAGDALQWQAKHDRSAVMSKFLGKWTPQLSSKQVDLVADGQTWTNRSILAEFLKTRQANPNAVIVNTSEWSVFDVGGWWVTLSGELYATADEANAWCDSQGYDSEHCLAKRMESSGSPQGTTKSR